MIKKYLYGALAAVMSILSAAAWWYREAAQDANKAARKAEHKARRNEAARKHVEKTNEATREVEDDIRKSGADARRDELRQYASSSGDSD